MILSTARVILQPTKFFTEKGGGGGRAGRRKEVEEERRNVSKILPRITSVTLM